MRMRISAWLLAALAAGFVASCGKQPAPSADQGQSGAADAAGAARGTDGALRDRAAASDDSSGTARSDGGSAAEDTVFAPLLDDVERARAVQQTVDEQAERLRKEIEKAEGASQ